MPQRPTLVVAGFLGRGNCGDEALFQSIYETFAPDFDIVASVDQHGAYPGFWDWYPYNACRIVHQTDAAMFRPLPRPAGLIVGGGGLPFGFAANQVMTARCFAIPCALAGTDIGNTATLPPGGAAAVADYLRLFDLVALRSALGVQNARAAGVDVSYGADWALALPTDQAEHLEIPPNAVAITLREFSPALTPPHYAPAIHALLAGLRARSLAPFLLPFAPEDERFLAEQSLTQSAPIHRTWWNPRHAQQLIAQSAAVISVGRLHPLIFAATTRTPIAALIPPALPRTTPPGPSKMGAMAAEFGITLAHTVEDLLAHIDNSGLAASNPARLADSQHRLAAMIAALRALFLR